MSYRNRDFSHLLINQAGYYNFGSSLQKVFGIINSSEEGRLEIERAKVSAEKIHKGQKRDIGEPYINHSYNVVGGLILLENERNPYVISAAYMHDIEEMKEIKRSKDFGNFDYRTTRMVRILTKKPREPNEHYRLRIINSTFPIIKTKTSDLRHNTSDLWLALLSNHLETETIDNKLEDFEVYKQCFSAECPRTWVEVEKNIHLFEVVQSDLNYFSKLLESGQLNQESLLSHLHSEKVLSQT